MCGKCQEIVIFPDIFLTLKFHSVPFTLRVNHSLHSVKLFLSLSSGENFRAITVRSCVEERVPKNVSLKIVKNMPHYTSLGLRTSDFVRKITSESMVTVQFDKNLYDKYVARR